MKKLGFGLMRLPLLDKDDYSSVDIERFKNMADTFLANGFTYFDTAYPYHRGNSEVAFREAVVKRYPRSAYMITDKLSLFMIWDENEIPGFFEKQLQQLGVDYVDYYWLHGLNAQTYYSNLTQNHGKASECLKCGNCEKLEPSTEKARHRWSCAGTFNAELWRWQSPSILNE